MKKLLTIRFIVLLVVAVLFLAVTGVVYAQTTGYDLSWWTVDGGGGSSTAGAYSLVGSVGQPDAGVMSGGNYILAGGFLGGGAQNIIEEPFSVYLPIIVR